jgi:hypothetical protein
VEGQTDGFDVQGAYGAIDGVDDPSMGWARWAAATPARAPEAMQPLRLLESDPQAAVLGSSRPPLNGSLLLLACMHDGTHSIHAHTSLSDACTENICKSTPPNGINSHHQVCPEDGPL